MTNRINGDFDQDSIEAFRSAYAAQILEPEDLETDPYTGLPSDVVLNTSPWIQHTGLWKANDGTDKNFVPNQVLVPGEDSEPEELDEGELDALLEELLREEETFENDGEEEIEESVLDRLSLEEIDALLEELDREIEEEGVSEDLIDGNFETSIDQNDSEREEEEISDDEIDALIAELEAELALENEEG